MNRFVSFPSIALFVLSSSACASSSAATEPAGPAPVHVRVVKSGSGNGQRWVAASLAASRHATLSTRMAASVRAVQVEEGAMVAQGQLVVSLSDGDVRAQRAAAETALSNAAANERRILALTTERAATPSELEMAQAQRAQATAAVAAARASMAYTEIRAPFAGTVQSRHVNTGDLVGPGQPLVEIEGAGLELQATLSEHEVSNLAIGQRVHFQADDTHGEAEITALASGGDALSHRRVLRARVVNGAPRLRSGTFVRMELPVTSAPPTGAWVPRSALVERGDLAGVFVAEAGHANLRWLSLGDLSGDQVPVRAGLDLGEAVIDAPGALRDGQAVEVSREE